MMANLLVIGSGGREHALAWGLSKSSLVKTVLVAPGNGGTLLEELDTGSKILNVDININDNTALIDLCKKENIELVVIGPEVPLVNGISDDLQNASILCFGPSKMAARLEGSKAFSKDFMARNGIPTATHRSFTDYNAAVEYVKGVVPEQIVIKASGLAAGKGVILPKTSSEALYALKMVMIDNSFGTDAGTEVVIEERMEGPEVSVFAFSDGETVQVLPSSQDHKRLCDGDQGPNTGGMGALCPSPKYTHAVRDIVEKEIVQRSIDSARDEGFPFMGLLYCGIMLTSDGGPKLLEYNCRFGDPETQAVLRLVESDLFEVMTACAKGRLDTIEPIRCTPNLFSTCVVLASEGYPVSYSKGKIITGFEEASKVSGVKVFHAGTRLENGRICTSGGRVLAVSATGSTLEEAISAAYKGVYRIKFDGAQFRTDIGTQAVLSKDF